MRGNGLEATSYVAIADLDPRVADNMLDVLREAGVAAYAEPCAPQQGLLLEVTLPPAPLDRLHVDREEALQARQLLKRLLSKDAEDAEDSDATPSGSDDDQVWAQIVQAYESDSKDPVAPWPTAEDADEAETDDETSAAVKTKDRSDAEAGDETEPAATPTEQDRYVPPPPPPLPKLDSITKLCWGVTLAGPVLMLLAAFASAYVPSWFLPLGVVAFVGGFVMLVFRMRSGPPDESDDGAVV